MWTFAFVVLLPRRHEDHAGEERMPREISRWLEWPMLVAAATLSCIHSVCLLEAAAASEAICQTLRTAPSLS